MSDFIVGFLLSFTGLIPFLHANTIVGLVGNVKFTEFGLFAVALVFSRVSFEFLANLKFGVASEETVFSLKKIKELDGHCAIRTVLLHCIAAMFVSLVFFPFFSIYAAQIYSIILPATPFLLIAVFVWFVVMQENKINALIIGLLAGAVGIVLLEKNLQNALFILLTGLYAVPMLILKQDVEKKEKVKNGKMHGFLILIGSLIGMASAFLPAMTPMVLTVIALGFMEKNKPSEFIGLNASILGSRTVSDFAALEFLSKGRSGATAKMLESQFYNFPTIYIYLLIGISLTIITSFIAFKIFDKFPSGALSAKVRLAALLSIFAYVYSFSNFAGVIALVAGSLVGLTCNAFNVSKGILGSSIIFASVKNFT